MTEGSRPQDEWTPERIADAADALARYRESAVSAIELFGRQPQPGSAIASSMGDIARQAVYGYAAWRLFAGADHLWGLSLTMHPHRPPYSGCFALARACIEASAWAAWLLDESVDETRQIGRGCSERLDNVRNQNRVHPDPHWLASREDDIVQSGRRHGVEPLFDKNGKKIIGFDKEARPDYTKRVNDFLQAHFAASSSDGWLYAFLSAHVHSTNFALVGWSELTPEDESGWGAARVTRPLALIGMSAYLASNMHASVLAKLAKAGGHKFTPAIQWEDSNG